MMLYTKCVHRHCHEVWQQQFVNRPEFVAHYLVTVYFLEIWVTLKRLSAHWLRQKLQTLWAPASSQPMKWELFGFISRQSTAQVIASPESEHLVKSWIILISSDFSVYFPRKFYHRQFQSAMLFKDSALLDRIFRVFDADDDNEIIFSEYLSCMSSISNKATKEEKLKCQYFIVIFGSFVIPRMDGVVLIPAGCEVNGMCSAQQTDHILWSIHSYHYIFPLFIVIISSLFVRPTKQSPSRFTTLTATVSSAWATWPLCWPPRCGSTSWRSPGRTLTTWCRWPWARRTPARRGWSPWTSKFVLFYAFLSLLLPF